MFEGILQKKIKILSICQGLTVDMAQGLVEEFQTPTLFRNRENLLIYSRGHLDL